MITLGAVFPNEPTAPPTATDLNPSAPASNKTAVAIKSVEEINALANAIFALLDGTAAQVAKAKADRKAAVKNQAAKGEKIYVPDDAAKKAGLSYWGIGGIAAAAVVGGLLLWWLLKRK